MLVDVDVKFLAIALIFPVGNFVAQAEKVGIAAKVEITDQHAAEVADVADLVTTEAKSAEKCDDGHAGDNPLHFDGNWNWDDVGAAIGKKNGTGDENTEYGAGSADGRSKRIFPTPEHRERFYDDVQDASADSGEEVVAQKAVAAPHQLDFAAKHPKREHVENDVPDVGDVMQKKIGKGLPDAEQRDDSGGNQAKPFQEPGIAAGAAKILDEGFENKDCNVGDDQELNTRCDIEVEADAVSADSGARGHTEASLRLKCEGVKPVAMKRF